jgi:hypothetical protein
MATTDGKDLVELMKWIEVSEDMPDDSIDVLVFGKMCETDTNSFVWPGYFDSADDCWRCSHGNEIERVTHWAEMPAGPSIR